MPSLYRTLRRAAGNVKRAFFPRPEIKAWRDAARTAERLPRYTRGRIQMMQLDLEYVDLLTVCPQWNEIYIRKSMAFDAPSPNPRILDCGANIGLVTVYLKQRFPGARITAFEADPQIADVLRGNLSRNGFGDVEVIESAVWSSAGSVEFRCEGADSGTVNELAGSMRGETRSVAAVRLRDWIEREPIDLLKLDIEGGESAVLADCADVLHNVRAMILELHELRPERRNAPAILELLTNAGFAYSIDELVEMPYHGAADAGAPFPYAPRAWAYLVRAWRPATNA